MQKFFFLGKIFCQNMVVNFRQITFIDLHSFESLGISKIQKKNKNVVFSDQKFGPGALKLR